MKKFFTLAAALLPLCSLIAQTFLNQDFGSSQAQVQEFLKSKHLSSSYAPDDNTLVAITETYTVTYSFANGSLYKIETVADFSASKDAAQVLANFRESFNRNETPIIDIANDKALRRFAALENRELHEVSAYALSKNATQVRLLSLDLDRTPGMAMDELRQNHELFAMIK